LNVDYERRTPAGQNGGPDIDRRNLRVGGEGGEIIGRVKIVGVHIAQADLDHAFQPLVEAVAGNTEAMRQAEALKREAAKGYDAEDGALAGLVKSIMGLVPGSVAGLLSAFGAAALGGVAGPVTKWVLSEIQFK
jgi:hypothetical protein